MPSRSTSRPAPLTSSSAPERDAARAASEPRRLDSDALFAGADEIVIDHRGTVYRLRRTSLGKLILTK